MRRNVRLVFWREIRDQLRDHRMLLIYTALPVLLYPLMGLSAFQIGQYVHEHQLRVQVVGAEHLPEFPRLVVDGRISDELMDDRGLGALKVQLVPDDAAPADNGDASPKAARLPADCDVQIVVPPGLGEQLQRFYGLLSDPQVSDEELAAVKVPSPVIRYDTGKEESQAAQLRIREVIERYKEAIVRENLIAAGISPRATEVPFQVERVDTAVAEHRDAALWAKVFPFLLLIWALAGAFHPAVDMCAGEKERGTMETLLCSPATRREIVYGKLLAVVVVSAVTVMLNVLSMGLTGILLLQGIPEFGKPPTIGLLWLLLALIPVSVLFGALCMAIAAFARSSKEGHYYMMPLFLLVLPMVLLPLAPGTRLTLGYSLIPVSGLTLLLRFAIEGDYSQVLAYIAPVLLVTMFCAWLSVRWCVYQFNREGVLLR